MYLIKGLNSYRLYSLQSSLDFITIERQRVGDCLQINCQAGEGLTGLIVQTAGDSSAFFLLCRDNQLQQLTPHLPSSLQFFVQSGIFNSNSDLITYAAQKLNVFRSEPLQSVAGNVHNA